MNKSAWNVLRARWPRLLPLDGDVAIQIIACPFDLSSSPNSFQLDNEPQPATMAEMSHLWTNWPAQSQAIQDAAYTKEMNRYASLRDILISVRPAIPPPSTYPDPPTSSTPVFKPFSFCVKADYRLGDMVTQILELLPKPDEQAEGGRYEFVVNPGQEGRLVGEKSDGLLGTVVRPGETELEVRVGLRVVPKVKVEERRETGMKRAFGRLGLT